MTYRVIIKPSAEKVMRNLHKKVLRTIARKIDLLAGEPRPHGAVKLRGLDDLYRIRVQDYRIVYQIRDQELLILVIRIGHRKDVYRELNS